MSSRAAGRVVARLRGLSALGAIAVGLWLTGCASAMPRYQATVSNARALQALPGGSVSVGRFTAGDESLNHLSVRGNAFVSPYGDSYAEYFREALKAELESAGKLRTDSAVVITGELLVNSLEAGVSTGAAKVSARVAVTRDTRRVFETVLSTETQWESSFIGAIAIPAAQQNYADAVRQLLGKLFANQEFQQSLR